MCYSKDMFKKSCTAIVVGLMLFNVAFAQSNTPTSQELLNVIKQLQAQIQLLQKQIADLQNQVQSVKTELKFSRVLTQGAIGDDVKQFKKFLKTFPDVYPEGLVTGYFGPLTETAIKKFQEKNGIESVGVVGPKTQAKLNELAITGAGQSGVIPSGIASASSSSSSTPSGIVPATPAIAATPAIPATSSTPAMPAVPAIPATPASPGGGGGSPSPQPSPTPTPTPTPTTTSPSSTYISADAVKILSPNGGEQWTKGQAHEVRWENPLQAGFSNASYFDWEVYFKNGNTEYGSKGDGTLAATDTCRSVPVTQSFCTATLTSAAIPDDSNFKAEIIMGRNCPPGSLDSCYYIPVPLAPGKDTDLSDNTFSIVSSVSTPTSSPPVVDTTAPSIPAGLTATAASSAQINLSWVASTDNVGVMGYKIYRNGVLATSTPSGVLYYYDGGLSSGTSYSYTVAAYDAAGNNS